MATQIFVNLPVQSLSRSVEFFKQLGYTFNAQFTNEHGTCMVISENIYAMLLVKDFFKTFVTKEIADTDFDGVTGHISFDQFGDTNNKVLTAYEIKDGKYVAANTSSFNQ